MRRLVWGHTAQLCCVALWLSRLAAVGGQFLSTDLASNSTLVFAQQGLLRALLDQQVQLITVSGVGCLPQLPLMLLQG